MGFVEPLTELLQIPEVRLDRSCNTQFVSAGAHEIFACPAPAGAIASVGAPSVWIAMGNAQKPPVREYGPFVIGPPASG